MVYILMKTLVKSGNFSGNSDNDEEEQAMHSVNIPDEQGQATPSINIPNEQSKTRDLFQLAALATPQLKSPPHPKLRATSFFDGRNSQSQLFYQMI